MDECQNKSKAVWRVINDITKRKKSTSAVLSKLKLEDGRFVKNSKQIADTLNSFFINVGPKLAKKITTL